MTQSAKIIRLLLLLLILAGVLPFIFPWQKPLLSWRSLSLPGMPKMEASLPEIREIIPASSQDTAPEAESSQVTVYRWRDKQGNWQFSNEAPHQGEKYEQMLIDPNTNLLQAESPDSAEKPAPDQGTTQAAENGLGYTAEELAQLKEKAEAAKRALEQHYREQERRLQELR